MTTTLTTRNLTSPVVKYKFSNQILSIYIDSNNHKIIGSVKITLANCKVIKGYEDLNTTKEDIFNGTHIFEYETENRLVCNIKLLSGELINNSETELENNGSSITALVDNVEHTIEAGTYLFKLIESNISVFDGALLKFQEQDIYKSYEGKYDIYAENNSNDYSSINNRQLTFENSAKISIQTIGANTNIPILILKTQ